MLVPAAIGAGLGYLRAPKAKKGAGAVKGALWGVGVAFVLVLILVAVGKGVDEMGLFESQQGGTL